MHERYKLTSASEAHQPAPHDGGSGSPLKIPQLLEKKWVHWLVFLEDGKAALDVFCTFLKSRASGEQNSSKDLQDSSLTIKDVKDSAQNIIFWLTVEQDNIDSRIDSLRDQMEIVMNPEDKLDEKERARIWAEYLFRKKTAVNAVFEDLCKELSTGTQWDSKEAQSLSYRWEKESRQFFHAQCACMVFLTGHIDEGILKTKYDLNTSLSFAELRKNMAEAIAPSETPREKRKALARVAVWAFLHLRERRDSFIEFRHAAQQLDDNTAALSSPEFNKISFILKSKVDQKMSPLVSGLKRMHADILSPRNRALLHFARRQCELENACEYFRQWKEIVEETPHLQTVRAKLRRENVGLKRANDTILFDAYHKAKRLEKDHKVLFAKYQEELEITGEQANELGIEFRLKSTDASNATKDENGVYYLTLPRGFRTSRLPEVNVFKRTQAAAFDASWEQEGNGEQGEGSGSGKRIKSSTSGWKAINIEY
jgi:hypothetical protein